MSLLAQPQAACKLPIGLLSVCMSSRCQSSRCQRQETGLLPTVTVCSSRWYACFSLVVPSTRGRGGTTASTLRATFTGPLHSPEQQPAQWRGGRSA